ncbi:DUF1444 family protein [Brevibacillus fulvus]|uniref:Uncharacterized protein YtpQ (UPF0354 family) n=1 Tax=Brevibacillus fulvus TaxID=1125967 RepID=A0A938Y1W8_9BACL|nr:DUF1444 family protein [Brevibacillus fulvus]MBM7590481.1 uncharacterized protein YtpQ (UPF0354 family) [Brevibacillus fulvus]
MSEQQEKLRDSIRRRVVELLERELPAGIVCQSEAEQIEIRLPNGKERHGSLRKLFQTIEQRPEQRRELIHSFVSQLAAAIKGELANRDLKEKENRVYPVLRHVSFASGRNERLIVKPHTAETVIGYALDQQEGYLLIDQEMLEEAGWTEEKLDRCARENLRSLPYSVRTQKIGDNRLHFISPRDGYAASRILLDELLHRFDQERTGAQLGVAIPHQDVLIIGDLADEQGALLLARLAYDFASKGPVPITPLPFYYEAGELAPYLVVQHGKQMQLKRKE